eukprot:1159625-Pelagomonas_calceolata.AAC.7
MDELISIMYTRIWVIIYEGIFERAANSVELANGESSCFKCQTKPASEQCLAGQVLRPLNISGHLWSSA